LNDKQLETVLHPYRIAKEVGCKFYLGGDAHHPEAFGENLKKFNKIIDLLDLHEKDKWDFIIKQRA
jgi:histidinol phosphatase-like PHP family hydrolase